MKRLIALVALISTSAHSQDVPVFGKKAELLKTGIVTPTYSKRDAVKGEMNFGYHLSLEGGPVRVWDTNSKGFPGYQPPIIQELGDGGKVLASHEVSDPCWMLNGRIHRMRHTNRIFIYIECRYRQWATPPGTHIFEITKDHKIIDGGIYWSEADLKLGPEEASKEGVKRSDWSPDGLKVKKFELGPGPRTEPQANPAFIPETSNDKK